jgi:hypothetical protein
MIFVVRFSDFFVNRHFIFFLLGKFDIEKQNLFDELDTLRRARDALEQEKRLRDQDLRLIRDQTRASADELKNTSAKVRILEQQVCFFLNQ